MMVEHSSAIKKRKSAAVLPVMSVLVITPIWLVGLVSIGTFSQIVGSYLNMGDEATGKYIVQFSVSLTLLAYLCGFIRSMYTLTLLDNGEWWELRMFKPAMKKARALYYFSEIGTRALLSAAFIVHQFSINRLSTLLPPKLSANWLESLLSSLSRIYGSLGDPSLRPYDNKTFENIWIQVAVSGYFVFFLMLIWTLLTYNILKKYSKQYKKDSKKAMRELRAQRKTQIWAFFTGLVITTWIYIFSQAASGNNIFGYIPIEDIAIRRQIIAIGAIFGAAFSVMMLFRVFIPQTIKLVLHAFENTPFNSGRK